MPSDAVSLVVTDLDGTLWHREDEVDPAVVAAVGTLAARGVPLLLHGKILKNPKNLLRFPSGIRFLNRPVRKINRRFRVNRVNF